jgi:hypothetical protein
MTWRCIHCESWLPDNCKLGHKVYPRGGFGSCRDFERVCGGDDDLGRDAETTESSGGRYGAAVRSEGH